MEESPTSGARLSRRSFLAVTGAGMASLAGCIAQGEGSEIGGEIRIDGSNTVSPHASLLAYEFWWRNNDVNVITGSSGTGAGFQRFCRSETDIQTASRPITDEEREHCEENGVAFIELEALLDGIALFVNPNNDWVEPDENQQVTPSPERRAETGDGPAPDEAIGALTTEQAAEMWRSGSPVETWADVDSDWPDEEVQFFGRDSASGTFDSFTSRLVGSRGNIRRGYSQAADTNNIVRGVRGNTYAIGFGGAGFYYENEDELKLIGLDETREGEDALGDTEAGYVLPTTDTIEQRQYPLSRPMFTYINVEELNRPEVQAFAKFYFEQPTEEELRELNAFERGVVREEDVGGPDSLMWTQYAAREVGFYATPTETLLEAKEKLEDKIAEVA